MSIKPYEFSPEKIQNVTVASLLVVNREEEGFNKNGEMLQSSRATISFDSYNNNGTNIRNLDVESLNSRKEL